MKALNWKRLFAVLVACTFVFAACGMDNSPTPMPNPTVNPDDPDGDGLPTQDEINVGLDPYNAFTDGKTIDNQNPSWLMQHPEYGLALAAVLNAVAHAIPGIGGRRSDAEQCTYTSAEMKGYTTSTTSQTNDTSTTPSNNGGLYAKSSTSFSTTATLPSINRILTIKGISCQLTDKQGNSVDIEFTKPVTVKLKVTLTTTLFAKAIIEPMESSNTLTHIGKFNATITAKGIKLTYHKKTREKTYGTYNIPYLPLPGKVLFNDNNNKTTTATRFIGICKWDERIPNAQGTQVIPHLEKNMTVEECFLNQLNNNIENSHFLPIKVTLTITDENFEWEIAESNIIIKNDNAISVAKELWSTDWTYIK